MIELLFDVGNLIGVLVVSIWEILVSATNLIIIDDPFWRGVELTLLVLVAWNNRKELIQLIDRVPLLGGLVARGLELSESAAEYLLDKAHDLWHLVRSNTWDKAVSFILKTDKNLRE